METQIPGAPPVEVPSRRQGCTRSALIGCGVVALVVLACLVGLYFYVRSNPTVMTDLVMRQVESHYGPDVTEQDKADLRAAYQEFRAAANEKRLDRSAAERLQMISSTSRSNEVNREQVQALTRAFREAAGRGPGGPASSASPPPAPTRTP